MSQIRLRRNRPVTVVSGSQVLENFLVLDRVETVLS
jgi:hypothetical protein